MILHVRHIYNFFSFLSAISVKCFSLIEACAISLFKTRVSYNCDEVIEIYLEYHSSVETFDTELIIGKQQFLNIENSPSTLRDTLNICDKDRFANIFVLLQIAFTFPITSRSCKQGASSLKNLRTYMPEFMTEKRLTGIALIHIHYAKTVDLNKVVEMFAKRHPRKH